MEQPPSILPTHEVSGSAEPSSPTAETPETSAEVPEFPPSEADTPSDEAVANNPNGIHGEPENVAVGGLMGSISAWRSARQHRKLRDIKYRIKRTGRVFGSDGDPNPPGAAPTTKQYDLGFLNSVPVGEESRPVPAYLPKGKFVSRIVSLRLRGRAISSVLSGDATSAAHDAWQEAHVATRRAPLHKQRRLYKKRDKRKATIGASNTQTPTAPVTKEAPPTEGMYRLRKEGEKLVPSRKAPVGKTEAEGSAPDQATPKQAQSRRPKAESFAVPIDPWETALEYVASLQEKYGDISMSPESLTALLKKQGLDEAEAQKTARDIHSRMQREGIVAHEHIPGKGFIVLLNPEGIRSRIKQK
jgi:hypothetical protein